MKKLLTVLLTVVMLSSVFTGCSPSDKGVYEAHLLPGTFDPNIFKEGTSILESQQGTETPAQPDEHKEVLHNDELHDLTLNKSLSGQWNVYMTEDNKITCWFDIYSERLRMISAENWFDTSKAEDMDQEAYIKWIKQIVGEYYTEDWSVYTLSCKTTITDTYAGSPVQSTKKGFLTAYDEHETVTAYTFRFTKYINDFATADAIQAYIRLDTGFVALEFSGHSFDGVKDIKVDKEKVNRSVSQFIVNSINNADYSYQKYKSNEAYIAYVNGKLSYICDTLIGVITMSEDEKDIENLEVVQQIILYLE